MTFFHSAAQSSSAEDVITIKSYVPEFDDLTSAERASLSTMLNRMMANYGCAGSGFDNRFVVVPKVQTVRSETAGLDSKYVVELDLTLFIGDGTDGTLFSSTQCTLRGVGESEEKARLMAFRKTPVRTPEMRSFVEQGKRRIVEYYEQQAPAIIATAENMAHQQNYEEAIAILFSIPTSCSQYQRAQQLIGDYGLKYSVSQNDIAIREAQALWSSNPTDQGARAAADALARVSNPTQAQQNQIKTLLGKIDTKYDTREKRAHELDMLVEKNNHSENMARISSEKEMEKARYNAAAKVASAYYSSIPVYNVYSWWD